MAKARFEWDPVKDRENQLKHGVGFSVAQFAFADPQRVYIIGCYAPVSDDDQREGRA